MSKVRCIIVEDEPLAAKVLQDYIGELEYLELLGIFKDAILASEFLQSHHVDLIFLDIHLPKLKGMEFIKTLSNPPHIIITTAYHQYAVEGFELNVIDYLMKPIEFDRFLAAVNKIPKTNLSRSTDETIDKNYIFLTVQQKQVKIKFQDIIYIESQKEYVKVVTNKGTHISKLSTHKMESRLPPHMFYRVHRSFIVGVDHIDSFTSDAVDVSGHNIPVGRSYRAVLRELFDQ